MTDQDLKNKQDLNVPEIAPPPPVEVEDGPEEVLEEVMSLSSNKQSSVTYESVTEGKSSIPIPSIPPAPSAPKAPEIRPKVEKVKEVEEVEEVKGVKKMKVEVTADVGEKPMIEKKEKVILPTTPVPLVEDQPLVDEDLLEAKEKLNKESFPKIEEPPKKKPIFDKKLTTKIIGVIGVLIVVGGALMTVLPMFTKEIEPPIVVEEKEEEKDQPIVIEKGPVEDTSLDGLSKSFDDFGKRLSEVEESSNFKGLLEVENGF